MNDQQAEITWGANGTPISSRFDDPYFSIQDGVAETRHVFLGGNDLPARFRDGFHIGELGFGTGLNLLTALESFRASGTTGKLRFTSFEAFPMAPVSLRRALGSFEMSEADLVIEAVETGKVERSDLSVRIIFGDARQTITDMDRLVDAWFLDGFSPAKNPELWEAPLMAQVGCHTAPRGTFATYTAAGHVRRALTEAGFEVTRVPGFGRKRHMSVGVMK